MIWRVSSRNKLDDRSMIENFFMENWTKGKIHNVKHFNDVGGWNIKQKEIDAVCVRTLGYRAVLNYSTEVFLVYDIILVQHKLVSRTYASPIIYLCIISLVWGRFMYKLDLRLLSASFHWVLYSIVLYYIPKNTIKYKVLN